MPFRLPFALCFCLLGCDPSFGRTTNNFGDGDGGAPCADAHIIPFWFDARVIPAPDARIVDREANCPEIPDATTCPAPIDAAPSPSCADAAACPSPLDATVCPVQPELPDAAVCPPDAMPDPPIRPVIFIFPEAHPGTQIPANFVSTFVGRTVPADSLDAAAANRVIEADFDTDGTFCVMRRIHPNDREPTCVAEVLTRRMISDDNGLFTFAIRGREEGVGEAVPIVLRNGESSGLLIFGVVPDPNQ